ncbi:MAG: restriction endonuclease subunit S [Burkholderiales bacterium]|nr:restriction endonuclease subunit S [Burkholderiales bacterium]
MSFPRYEKYKDSGVEWLGDVPEHWEVKKLKHVKSLSPNAFVDGPFGSNLKSEHFVDDGDVYVIESNFATQGQLRTSELKTISYNHFESIRRSETKEGDIIIAKIGAQFGKSAILGSIDKPAVVSGNSMKLTIDDEICETLWAYWQLFNLKANGKIDLLVNATAQPALSLGAMNELIFLLPPKNEQKKILNFLDRETTKIDELIAEQQRLIELLKEKRQAVISHVVAKGLNPDVPMKDSGIEWLGEVPEHWDVMALKRIAFLKSGDTITSNDIEETGEYPVYGGNGLRGYTSNYTHDGEYPLIGRQGALCGNINYAKGRFWASEHAVVVSLIKPMIIKWLGETLRAMNLNQYSVSAAQPGLSVEIVSNLQLPVPPLTEQQSIATVLNREITKIEKLIAEAKRAIELLKERRAALISAAVTGKIDVRGTML